MAKYILKRLISGLITLFVVLVLVFVVFQALGDPSSRILPVNSTAEQIRAYSQANGYSDPLLERLGRYLSGAIRLDFGTSTVRNEPAINAVLTAIPRSLLLAAASIVATVAIGVSLGVLAGLTRNRVVDKAVQFAGAIAASVPEFWSGLILIILFAVMVPIFPTSGFGGFQFLVLPAAAMSIPPIGRLIFVVRESIRSIAEQPFALVARSKGLSRAAFVNTHILRAALVPIISIGAVELTRMAIGGVVVIENIFAWPGIGQLYVQAMQRYDVSLVSATLFCATALVLAFNLILDIVYTRLDPRIRLERQHG
jgi:peptide/nickel transport system permease protein